MDSNLSRLTALALAIAVGCATSATSALWQGRGDAALDPLAFFTGRTQGAGELDKMFSRPVQISVDSVGVRQGDTLTLDQTIREGEKPPRVRRWVMKRIGADRYTGTLTDATRGVDVTVTGLSTSISYTMKGGFDVDQQLTLQGDRRTLLNRMQVKKFGVRVATLRETIRKLD
jgi:hypothetical protein